MGYKSYLCKDKIKTMKFYDTDVIRNRNKVDFPLYTRKGKKDLLFVLQEYGSLCQEKGLTHITYPPFNLYGYFRKLLKGVSRKHGMA